MTDPRWVEDCVGRSSKKGQAMSKTPSEAAVRASGRILAAIVNTPNGKKFIREEGARLIDEAYGTREVVNACQLVIDDWDIATGQGGALEDVPDPPKIAACRKLLSKLKGTDDGKDKGWCPSV